jgi:hypothetical protein
MDKATGRSTGAKFYRFNRQVLWLEDSCIRKQDIAPQPHNVPRQFTEALNGVGLSLTFYSERKSNEPTMVSGIVVQRGSG